ncbi:hypothetical protein H0H92_007369 [Tricholoma furcatifolium]|nr:hypothetical protein H0H92_007369 [Tricholoma furcatifolium]
MTFNVVPQTLETRVAALQAQIEERVVGPIDLIRFSSFFRPISMSYTQPTKEQIQAFEDLPDKFSGMNDETPMYGPLVEAFNTLSSTFLFADTHAKPIATFDGQDIKPDLTATQNNIMQTMLDVKFNNSDDPFDDGEPTTFIRSTLEARHTLGQITSYATSHQAHQFRTHVFSFLIFPTYLRALRWDRSGVVVTEKLTFKSSDAVVLLTRFVSATAGQLGLDSTVVTDFNLSGKITKDKIDKVLGLEGNPPLVKIVVGTKEFIIARDQSPGSTSPIGRSTRCFKAYCLNTENVVLLKDSWRVVSDSLRPEHEIYRQLHEHKVPHILQVIDAEDVGTADHATQTEKWVLVTKLKRNIRTLRHYRIAIEYVPCRLDQFTHVRQMITAIRDAAIAHSIAATVAQILHRDISVGNIMFRIDDHGNVHGYLIDWDLSLDLSVQGNVAAQRERTGTWQFTAARLLANRSDKVPLVHERVDDVESFFHVTHWISLRYTAHSMEGHALAQSLYQNFDNSHINPATGQSYVSMHRASNLVSGLLVSEPAFKNAGILRALYNMRRVLGHRYMPLPPTPETPEEQEEYRFQKEVQEKGLRLLNDPQWLPTYLLTGYLNAPHTDWNSNSGFVNHTLVLPTKYTMLTKPKRKTESSYHSEGSRKSARLSNKSTPQEQD